MAHAKKGALHQILVPMVDATDFASVESGITESDFNSGATRKFFGWNTGVSDATTSGAISKAGSLTHSGVFRLTLKTTENNYDQMMVRVTKTGCAEQIICWSNVNSDDSDMTSQMTVIQSMASDAHSAAAQANSRALVNQSAISDVQSALTVTQSLASDAHSAAAQANSRVLLNQSRISDLQSLLSDVHSDLASYLIGLSAVASDAHSAAAAGASRVLLVQSRLSDLDSRLVTENSNVLSQLTVVQSMASDAASAAVQGNSRILLTQSRLSDLDSRLVSDVSDLASAVAALSGIVSDAHSAAAAGASRALLNQSRISDVQSYLVALSALVSDIESQIDAGLPMAASDISDLRSAITAAGFDGLGSDPATVPAVNASRGAKLDWLTAVSRNKLKQTGSVQSLRNDGDSADIASAAVTADATSVVRAKFS